MDRYGETNIKFGTYDFKIPRSPMGYTCAH